MCLVYISVYCLKFLETIKNKEIEIKIKIKLPNCNTMYSAQHISIPFVYKEKEKNDQIREYSAIVSVGDVYVILCILLALNSNRVETRKSVQMCLSQIKTEITVGECTVYIHVSSLRT